MPEAGRLELLSGVAVPVETPDPGAGTSPRGSARKSRKKLRQFVFEGTKWPIWKECARGGTYQRCENGYYLLGH